MITDRVGTMTFILLLAFNQVPETTSLILWIMMDVTSHWARTVSSLKVNTHHKQMKNRFSVLNFYYNVPYGMTPFCVGAELYLICVYSRHFLQAEILGAPLYWLTFALFWGKFVIHGFQFLDSCLVILEIDAKKRNGEKDTN